MNDVNTIDRREFFNYGIRGIWATAFASLLAPDSSARAGSLGETVFPNPKPRAKRVIVPSRSLSVGDEFDDMIIAYMKRDYNLMIGESTAEEIKIKIGSAYPLGEELSMDVKGWDRSTALRRIIRVRSEEIRDVLKEPLTEHFLLKATF